MEDIEAWQADRLKAAETVLARTVPPKVELDETLMKCSSSQMDASAVNSLSEAPTAASSRRTRRPPPQPLRQVLVATSMHALSLVAANG
jgi:hypothetical protein